MWQPGSVDQILTRAKLSLLCSLAGCIQQEQPERCGICCPPIGTFALLLLLPDFKAAGPRRFPDSVSADREQSHSLMLSQRQQQQQLHISRLCPCGAPAQGQQQAPPLLSRQMGQGECASPWHGGGMPALGKKPEQMPLSWLGKGSSVAQLVPRRFGQASSAHPQIPFMPVALPFIICTQDWHLQLSSHSKGR